MHTSEDFYEEEPVILEREVKTALKILGRSKSSGLDGIPIHLFQATLSKSLTRKCPEMWKTKQWPRNWKY